MIIIDVPLPKNCKDCYFRQNKTPSKWRCGITRAIQGGAMSVNAIAYNTEYKRHPNCPIRTVDGIIEWKG